MKIAILGIRGIPANYGGFETFAEELGARLVEDGHEVTVYGRAHYINHPEPSFRGIQLRILPTLRSKYFDTVVHTLLACLDTLGEPFDVVLACNAANAVWTWIPRLNGKRVALNVDGLERKRKKWNWLGKKFYQCSERLATWFPNAVVTDAEVIREYYRDKYKKDSWCIPYGATVRKVEPTGVLERFGLTARKYFLYVSRLEPENNAHLVIRAFEKVKTDLRLVVVGDAPYAAEYIAQLKSTRDPRIIFTGAIYGDAYHDLQQNAYAYLHATEVGGTHPALVEAMGHGNVIVANDTEENREVVGEAGLLCRMENTEALADKIQETTAPHFPLEQWRARARERAETHYHWARITREYEKLFDTLVRN